MYKKDSLKTAFAQWLPLAAAIVILSALVYVSVQQNYRQSANDPQIQIAQDIADAISKGSVAPSAIVSPQPTQDLSSSLSAFVIVYSSTSTPIGSSVQLDGKMPVPPVGTFDYVAKHGQENFTWQPKPGVRVAAVMVKFSGPDSGYVLAGRLLREVEVRETRLTWMSALAALAALLVTYLLMLISVSSHDKRHGHAHHEHGAEAAEHHHTA